MDLKGVLEKVKKEMNFSDVIVNKIGKVVTDNIGNKDNIISELVKKVNLSEIDAKKVYDLVKSALASEAGKAITNKVMDFLSSKKK